MSKAQLYRSFEDTHGIGMVYGYGYDGLAASKYIRKASDIDSLPNDLVYEWVN